MATLIQLLLIIFSGISLIWLSFLIGWVCRSRKEENKILTEILNDLKMMRDNIDDLNKNNR